MSSIDTDLDNAVLAIFGNGFEDDQAGSASEAPGIWAGLVRDGAAWADTIAKDPDTYERVSADELEFLRTEGRAGVIVTTDSQGFNHFHYYRDPAKLERDWEMTVEDLSVSDEDDPDYEPNVNRKRMKHRLVRATEQEEVRAHMAQMRGAQASGLPYGAKVEFIEEDPFGTSGKNGWRVYDIFPDGTVSLITPEGAEMVSHVPRSDLRLIGGYYRNGAGQTWHVVTSQGGIILGVYGSALLSEAQEKARRVERETGLPAFVDQIRGPRPAVGQFFTSPSAGSQRRNPETKHYDSFQGMSIREGGDEHAAQELVLYIENDAKLFDSNSQAQSIRKNLLRKMKKGVYDHKLAEQAWMYLMEAGAKAYTKEFGSSPRDWSTMFNKATRELAAAYFARDFEEEAKLGNFDHILP